MGMKNRLLKCENKLAKQGMMFAFRKFLGIVINKLPDPELPAYLVFYQPAVCLVRVIYDLAEFKLFSRVNLD